MRCWPPDIVPASWPERSTRIGNSSWTSSRRLARASASGLLAPPSSRLSVTVMSWNTKRSDGIIAMPALTFWREGCPVTSLPSNVMRPPNELVDAEDGADRRALAAAVVAEDAEDLARLRPARSTSNTTCLRP